MEKRERKSEKERKKEWKREREIIEKKGKGKKKWKGKKEKSEKERLKERKMSLSLGICLGGNGDQLFCIEYILISALLSIANKPTQKL